MTDNDGILPEIIENPLDPKGIGGPLPGADADADAADRATSEHGSGDDERTGGLIDEPADEAHREGTA